MHRHFIILVLCVCSFINSSSQHKEFEFKNFTQENGLPSNESYFVFRDSKNFLWMATDQGVVRFNGSKMERFELPDNVVFKIKEDSKGRIWFFSHTGKLAYFQDGRIYPFKYNDRIAREIKNILITDAHINDKDEIFINSGVWTIGDNYQISKEGVIQRLPYRSMDRFARSRFQITETGRNRYFVQRTVLNYYQSDSVTIERMVNGRKVLYTLDWSGGLNIHYGCIAINDKDLLLFCGKGIIRLNADGSYKVKFFRSVVSSVGMGKNLWVGFLKQGALLLNGGLEEVHADPILQDKSITSITSDHEGGTWFSTLEKGVFYLKNADINHLVGDSTLTGPVFRLCIGADSSAVYAKTTGIYKLTQNATSPVLLRYNSTHVSGLFIDGSRNLYLTGTSDIPGCPGGMFKKSLDPDYKKVFILMAPAEPVEHTKNRYLSSTYGFLVYYTLGSDFVPKPNSNCVVPDSGSTSIPKPGMLFLDHQKHVWIGTNNALYRIRTVGDAGEEVHSSDSLFKKGVTVIQQMQNDIYCIGIRFGGVALMQGTNIIARITESDGLLSNSVKYLLPLQNELWVATARGISVISFQSYAPLKYSIHNIGKNDGLYNLIIYQLMHFKGNILAATSNGIYEVYRPGQFISRKPVPIPFYINTVRYFKGDTSGISKIVLPYKNNRVLVRYSAVCFNLPDEIKYYYRFGNTDTSWREIAATELLLENLMPGEYDLEIRAGIPGEKRFSGIQKLQIIVEKPWWQNAWLMIGAIVLFFAIFFIFYKRRIEAITRREQHNTALNAKMMELEQTALRSQMNPHFIFNCLTSIQQLINLGSRDDANEYLVKFARLIRKTLELSAKPNATLGDEIDYLKDYLVLEQLRIPGQFEFNFEIGEDVDIYKTEIPNMMIQPLVENAIRHGIKHLDNRKGRIDIRIDISKDFLTCTVTDNGVGRAEAAQSNSAGYTGHKSYGINILKQRLAGMTGKEKTACFLEITDLHNSDGAPAGTRAVLQLPYKIIPS